MSRTIFLPANFVFFMAGVEGFEPSSLLIQGQACCQLHHTPLAEVVGLEPTVPQ